MLPSSERLRRASLFQRTYARGQSVSCPLFTMYALSRQPSGMSRYPLVGFVAGKKVHNKAVYRNQAKRRVREAYRQLRMKNPQVKQWYCLVWVLKKQAVLAGWEEIGAQVGKLLDQANKKFGTILS